MAIRIYSLAKELKIENKELVDICNKAGITGKGSALASLDDDEVAKVKAYLSSGDDSSTKAPAKAKAGGKGAEKKETGALSRDDYIPARKSDKIKVLGTKTQKAGESAGDADSPKTPPAKEKEQVVRLAQMPQAKQPLAKKMDSGEKVQKPDIKLPTDAIGAARKGKSAPLKQFTDTQKKKDQAPPKTAGRTGGGAGAGAAPTAGAPLSGRGSKARTKGKSGQDGEGAAMGDIRRQRQEKRKRQTKSSRLEGDDDRPTARRRRPMQRSGPRKNTAAPRKENVVVELPCTVRTFSEAAGVPAVKICFSLANMLEVPPNTLNINTQIDEETAVMLAEEMEVTVEFKQRVSLEDELFAQLEREDDPESLQLRPPIVTFLGHVDHGKTSLLDKIIGIDVVSGEAGGITQHIRAYQVDKDGRKVAFVDTPGHEAFTEMRARGANVTDVAVLVVAADDGVMPQTKEAISHAKAAEVPIVIALNKIDLPGVDENKAFQDLAALEMLPSEWGGDVEVIKTSAITGEGVDDLLETLLVTAELHEYKANPNRDAVGTCLEAEQEPGRGVIAKVMVQNGTLKVGDVVVCGGGHGKVKAMYDTLRPKKKVKQAGPSMPVNITGFDVAPEAGDRMYVLDDIAQAREIAERRQFKTREQSLGMREKPIVSLEEFQRRLEEGDLRASDADVVTLNLIIKADVRGSLEAIQKELGKISHPEVEVKILHQDVGAVTEGDVTLAHASGAVIVGFNVIPTDEARLKADKFEVEIRRYDVIYKVHEDIKATLEGQLKPEERIVDLGMALVKEIFTISRTGTIAGCHVTSGSIERGCRIRVNREGRTIGDYALDSLKRHKDDAKEVPRGMECGIKLAGFNDVKEADILEAYKIEEVARTL